MRLPIDRLVDRTVVRYLAGGGIRTMANSSTSRKLGDIMTLSLGITSALLICGPFGAQQEEPELPKPSPEHAILKKDVGKWDIEITMTFGGQEMKSKGTETVTMLGPFWSLSNMTYDYMGSPAHGHGVIGYDPEKKKFVGSWHESASPNLTRMEGTYDAKTKKLTMLMKGKGMDGKPTKFKSITTYTGANTKTFEFFGLKPGSDTEFEKNMEMKYTRARTKKKTTR